MMDPSRLSSFQSIARSFAKETNLPYLEKKQGKSLDGDNSPNLCFPMQRAIRAVNGPKSCWFHTSTGCLVIENKNGEKIGIPSYLVADLETGEIKLEELKNKILAEKGS